MNPTTNIITSSSPIRSCNHQEYTYFSLNNTLYRFFPFNNTINNITTEENNLLRQIFIIIYPMYTGRS
ncbi:hypothetical protein EB796_022632 [Bugula neritina]|uniref:Uncharacterized protein n=1 Tax=Bugula neritina TaxID=10212 RepID=A0A7J7IZU0_BUGNE|nr:hypothetical protein EB796_022632 [Bugula neritina]